MALPLLEEIGEIEWGPLGWVAAAAGVVALTPGARKGARAAAVKVTALGITAAHRLRDATAGVRESWSALVEEAQAERTAARESSPG